jgi:hypothetical protein
MTAVLEIVGGALAGMALVAVLVLWPLARALRVLS